MRRSGAATSFLLLAPPFFANAVYYAHCRRLIARREARPRTDDLARLQARGGTSRVAVIVVGALACVFVAGIVAAIALPAYQDFTRRTKATEAIVAASDLARQVGDYYRHNGRLPDDRTYRRMDRVPSRFVASDRLDPATGILAIAIAFGDGRPSGTVYLLPHFADDRSVTWRCKPSPAMARVVPASCRDAG